MAEQILVVTRKTLFGSSNERYFSGFLPSGTSGPFEKIIKESFEFMPRDRMEEDENYQQIIPYLVFRHGKSLFVYKRLKAGVEKRLHNLYSIGIGGHINPLDTGKSDIMNEALKREFGEEIDYRHPYKIKPLGYINDDSNAVGRVHFGMVFLIEGSSPDIRVREKESLSGRLMGKGEIEAIASGFESWSALVWDWLKRNNHTL